MYLRDVADRERLRSLVTHVEVSTSGLRKRTFSLRARIIQLAALFAALLPATGFAVSNVTIAWDASTDPTVAGYKIYYGGASGGYTNSISVGNTTSGTIPGLIEGRTYYFAATATNNSGLESDFSTEISYVVPVPKTNLPPTLNAIANVTINESSGLQTVALSGISTGDTNGGQTLTITAVSSNQTLIPNPTVSYSNPNATGSISFAPTPFLFGTATIAVIVNDGMASNNITTRTFTVTVNSVNQAPTLNPLADVTINENAAQQTVNLSGITSGATNESQTLAVTASSSVPGLIPNPSVTYTSPNTTGSIRFAPAPNSFGSAVITVTVNDGGASNNIVTQTFTVNVNPVNQQPTLTAIPNLTINQNAGLQTVNLSGISSGATNENQTLTVTASSGNTALIPNPSVSYTSPSATGSLTFTPVAFASGTATITVTVNDGGASNNIVTQSFTVTVNAVNQPPTLNPLANLTILENAPAQIVSLSGITSGSTNEFQTLTVTASSGNTTVIPNPTVTYTSPATNGSITFTPSANQFGLATITVTVNDGGASNNIINRSFSVTVDSPPTISSIPNQIIAVSSALSPVAFTIGDAETSVGSLTLQATSSNQSLVPNSAITLGGSGANRTIAVSPTIGQTGTANITITVGDGFATATSVFQLSVLQPPQPPTNLHVVSQ